jgi:hypothetical protein
VSRGDAIFATGVGSVAEDITSFGKSGVVNKVNFDQRQGKITFHMAIRETLKQSTPMGREFNLHNTPSNISMPDSLVREFKNISPKLRPGTLGSYAMLRQGQSLYYSNLEKFMGTSTWMEDIGSKSATDTFDARAAHVVKSFNKRFGTSVTLEEAINRNGPGGMDQLVLGNPESSNRSFARCYKHVHGRP